MIFGQAGQLKVLLKYVIVLTDETIMKNQYGQWLRKLSAFINMDLFDTSIKIFRIFITILHFDKHKAGFKFNFADKLFICGFYCVLFPILLI